MLGYVAEADYARTLACVRWSCNYALVAVLRYQSCRDHRGRLFLGEKIGCSCAQTNKPFCVDPRRGGKILEHGSLLVGPSSHMMPSIFTMDAVSSEDAELHPCTSKLGATSSSDPTESGQPIEGADDVADNNTEVEGRKQMASPTKSAPVSQTDMDVGASTNDIVMSPAPDVSGSKVVPDPGTESRPSSEEDGKQPVQGEQGGRISVKGEAVEENIDMNNVIVKAETQNDDTEANDVIVKAEAQNDDTEASDGIVEAAAQNDDPEANNSPDLVQDAPRWSSTTIGTYAIQCNACWKWRVIPTKEQYETLGENILEKPFVCENAQIWREDAKCEDPSDLEDDEPTILWAVDKHNIPCPPQGFYRKVVLRGENSKKFADIYYKAPCGKTLRSMVQVQKYLEEAGLGLHISQFCFTSPKPRPGVIKPAPCVVQKRPLKVVPEPPRKRMKGSIQAPTSNPGGQQVQGTNKLSSAKSRELSPQTPNAAGEQRTKVEESSEALNPLMAVKWEVVKPEIEEDEFMEEVKPSTDPAEPGTTTLEQPS